MTNGAADGLQGWRIVSIESLAEPKGIAYGVLKPGPQVTDGIPMLRVSDIRNGRVDRSALYKISAALDREFHRTKLKGGEVVLSIQGSVGRAAIVPLDLAGSNLSRTLAMIRLSDPALAPWVQRALESPHIQRAMRQVVGGTTRDSLNLRDLRRVEIAVAPEPQRRTILRLIDETDSLQRTSAAHLAAARRAIERFRQAVLAAACSGRLTADWRNSQTGGPQKPVLTAVPDVQSIKQRRAIEDFKAEELPELPPTWIRVPLAAVSESVLGKMLDKEKNRGEPHRYLRNIDVRWREFSLDNLQEMRFELGEEERYGLTPGDVLVCEGGEPGRAAVWRHEGSDIRFQKALHRVRCADTLLPDWLVDVLQAHAFTGFLSNYFTGSGIAHLTGVSLVRIPIPLPPTAEQAEIVRRVDQLYTLANKLEQRIDAALQHVERSSQAVLAKAFRGDLIHTAASAERLADGA